MKISTRGRYGLKAMVDIAAQCSDKECSCGKDSSPCTCNCVNLKSIAERQGISEPYLEQLIAPLKRAGYVKSVRGAKGGYIISKCPKEISVGEILRALEGSLCPVNCLEEGSDCSCGSGSCDHCFTRPVWEKIYENITTVVNSIMLEELIINYKKHF